MTLARRAGHGRSVARRSRGTRARVASGGSAALACLGCGVATFLGWITTPMHGGGRTSISGWGLISGGSDLVNGVDFNVLMAGEGSYRPGLPIMIVAILMLFPALVMSLSGPGARTYRVAAATLAAGGAFAAVWGTIAIVHPGDAIGVLPAGQAAPGVGPFLAGACGLVLLAVGILGLVGKFTASASTPRRGIQPRR